MTNGPTDPPTGEWANGQTHQWADPPTHQPTKRMMRLNVEIPEDLYLAIHARAGKLRTNKKDIVEELLRAGVREVANFVRLRKELNTPIDTMVQAYREQYSPIAKIIDEEDKEINELVNLLGVETDG